DGGREAEPDADAEDEHPVARCERLLLDQVVESGELVARAQVTDPAAEVPHGLLLRKAQGVVVLAESRPAVDERQYRAGEVGQLDTGIGQRLVANLEHARLDALPGVSRLRGDRVLRGALQYRYRRLLSRRGAERPAAAPPALQGVVGGRGRGQYPREAAARRQRHSGTGVAEDGVELRAPAVDHRRG